MAHRVLFNETLPRRAESFAEYLYIIAILNENYVGGNTSN